MNNAIRFYPRALVKLRAFIVGEADPVDTAIVPHRLTSARTSHKQANTCEVELMAAALPFDPRQIEGVFISVFIGAVETMLDSADDPAFLRFVGYLDRSEIEHDDRGETVKLHARDLSSRMRDTKPLPVAFTPRYSDTLKQAISRCADSIPGIFDAIGIIDNDAINTPLLSQVVGKRASKAQIELPTDISVWGAIEHVCGMVGMLVTMELNNIIVKSAKDQFSGAHDPVATFIFGSDSANLLKASMEKKFLTNRKGIKLVANDPNTRERVEAVYPPDGKLHQQRRPPPAKPATAHGAHTVPKPKVKSLATQKSERDEFVLATAYTQTALDACAERIWRERSRQEVTGEIMSPLWEEDGNDYLDLKNSDRIEIKIHPDLVVQVQKILDDNIAAKFLQDHIGVNLASALVLVRAARNPLTDLFYVHEAKTEFSSTGQASIDINYLNLIEIVEEGV